MKKPKIKTRLPKGSLIVDYGLKRVILPYKYPLGLYNNTELDIISSWCEKTFPAESWSMHRAGWPGQIYFLKESYITMFLLMWAK